MEVATSPSELQTAFDDFEDAEVMVEVYYQMLTLRMLSTAAVALQRQGKIEHAIGCIGDEAYVVGATLAARATDWVFPDDHAWGAAIARGMPLSTYVRHAFGPRHGGAVRHAPTDAPPAKALCVRPVGLAGAHVPQAVGAAWAAKIRGDDVATLALFGSESMATGALHDALNFAGVFRPPCVLVCRRHVDPADAGPPVADRALAYGLASATVDGTDGAAVMKVVRGAFVRARTGLGATLIEALLGARAPSVAFGVSALGACHVAPLGSRDPIDRLRDALIREARLDAATDARFTRQVRTAVEDAIASVEAAELPPASSLFDHVYARLPDHLRAQRDSNAWRK